LRWLALAVFVVALAQPRLVKGETQVKASGVDIVVAIDLPAAWRRWILRKEPARQPD